MTRAQTIGPVVVVILDGWGIGRDEPGNAILAARTPTMDRLLATYPNAMLHCSGEDVGLPEGQMGNSEVGHLNIGAGFVVYQWLTRLDKAVRDGDLAKNTALLRAMDGVMLTGGRLHLIGLVSDGGVHSHIRHLDGLIGMAQSQGLTDNRVLVHALTDGRDTAPDSGKDYIAQVEHTIAALGTGSIATVSGRYYAMDRDQRWERTEQAFRTIVNGSGERVERAGAAISDSYAAGVSDEFIEPRVIGEYDGLRDGDQIIWFNFRSDRARQLTRAMCDPAFDAFPRGSIPIVPVTTMTRYARDLPATAAYEEPDIVWPLSRAVSDAGLAQFHTAETEKYPHVTYFINGGREEPFPGEDRRMVPSPKVATYDLQPEMNAADVTAGVVAAVERGTYGLVIVNFANGDMVGHTGVFSATVDAIETVDACLGHVVGATLARGGTLLVTADHGNAEEMINRQTGGPMTAHTTNPVPVILVAPEGSPHRGGHLRQDGILSDIAPTLLDLLGVKPPLDMTQISLIMS